MEEDDGEKDDKSKEITCVVIKTTRR